MKHNPYRWLGLWLAVLVGGVLMPAGVWAQEPAGEVEQSAAEAEATSEPATAVTLDSPRAAMMTFLKSINDALVGREGAWPQVLATLDTSAVGEDQDVQRLAEQLKEVLDRLGEVTPEELPDAAMVQREGVRRFKYFPHVEHATLWERLGHAPGGSIWLEAGADDRWRFSARTVAEAGQLWDSMKDLPPVYEADVTPGRVFTVVGPTFELTEWWGWVVLLGGIFAGLTVGKIVQATLRGMGDRDESNGQMIRATVARNAASPASLALFTLGLMVGLWFIYMEEPVRLFFGNVLTLLYLLALGWFLFNLVEVVEHLFLSVTRRSSTRLDQMLLPLIRKSLRVFLVIVFTLVVAQNVFGLNITGWLAGLGIAGLALSLAAQDSVKNLFGSLTIFFDRPFTVGDVVSFGGVTGAVEEIGLRSTRIRIAAGHLITVPNMKFIDGTVENISRRPAIRREMNVTITYDTPTAKVQEAVELVKQVLTDSEVVAAGQFNMDKNPPRVNFDNFNADSLNIKAYYWYQLNQDPNRGFFSYLAHCEMVNLKLLQAFNEAGIEFAFPTQTLFLAGDPARKLTVGTTTDHNAS